ncbi:NUDIX hydrolase [Ornithinimicrobium cryptoxanthini]|uniref:NUDIX domain-containing protein n=1 Tax=Ornithinimicrobium cryptoxanthini TaxID=2934161 RepID=A0ABY4YER5_9MICO|nr:NUDIX domain-containing protein [Ornithinimicrobium cryptoxanthini]USQ75079.1 NUDIX domain-containing protein [Ornithinimicrobium cryptoxanthini]
MDFDTRVGCYAWIERDGSVLLTRWSGTVAPDGRVLHACWTLPGGGLELHETTEQAAVREVAEETGYAVALGELLGSGSHVVATSERYDPEADRPFLLLQLLYRAEVVGGELTAEVDGSTDDARWVPLSELSPLPAPASSTWAWSSPDMSRGTVR